MCPIKPKVNIVTVDPEYSGQRLDNFLLRELKGTPRSLIYRIVRRGEVRVNNGRAKVSLRLQGGDQVRIPPLRIADRPAARALPAAAEFHLKILFEDEHLLVIDKPAGIAVHAGSGIRTGLIEHLRATRPECRFLDLVHRLDRETSGCLVVAKRRSALRALHEDLRQNSDGRHRFSKKYRALVHGHWPVNKHWVEAPLRKNMERSGERMVIVADNGMAAKTRFTSLRCFATSTLVEATLITGRTHQVRVHAAWSGHPIAGDEKYGDKQANERYRAIGLRRLFLHASQLRFNHPASGQKIHLACPLPVELDRVLSSLQN